MHTADRVPVKTLPAMSAVRLAPARRFLDVAVSLTLLLLLAPLLLLVALVVAATSGSPVLFRQQRVEAGGGTFTLLKFRSMRTDCAGPGVTGCADPRVTRTGRVLRRLSMDELPQLWNVLRGDMTLVGPRPEIPRLARRYPPRDRWVFRHRPGLTGPCALRSRGYAAELDGHTDPEEYYLTVLVPRRTALDAEFLRHATAGRVIAFTARTAVYVLSALWDREGRP